MTLGIRAGDEPAFNAFYDAYVDRLYRYLLVVASGDESIARDALQDAMLRVLRYVKPIRDERILWGWLRRVARSAFIDIVRKRARRRRWECPLPHPGEVQEGVPEPDPNAVLLAALSDAVRSLGEDEQALLDAYYGAGRNQDDIARERATTRKAIESRLARLRRRLKLTIRDALRDDNAS